MNDSKKYSPHPISMSNLPESPRLAALVEKLAANAHDVWAEKRQNEGWSYGETKEPELKKTPLMVPYDDLPDLEKETDRIMVRMVLKAAIAEGWRIEPAVENQAFQDKPIDRTLSSWTEHLSSELKDASAKGSVRYGTFDMHDQPELALGLLNDAPIFSKALSILADTVQTEWKNADDEALVYQVKHRRIAWWAICSGTIAISLAIVQLILGCLSDEVPQATKWVAKFEIGFVALAGIAVVLGVSKHYHHHWLSKRQCAERLRILKFQALGWKELWCDSEAWKKRVIEETKTLSSLSIEDAEKWTMEFDSVPPDLPQPPPCLVSHKEVASLASYYLVKRLQFQKHYFEVQALKADRSAWPLRWKLPLILFFMSVLVVFVHGILELLTLRMHGGESHRLHYFETCLVGLAALLPVFGFGMRAWLSAFEVPRSRNLFRAKARALEEPIKFVERDANEVLRTMQHIARDEHFFANEHREWCRLQMEAEWFL